MNTNILSKCIEELKKEKPDLSYLRGMLETLVTVQDAMKVPEFLTHPSLHKTAMTVANEMKTPVRVNGEANDEASVLDAKARAAIDIVKSMGGQDTPQ